MDGVVVAKTVFSKKFMLHIMKSIDYGALCETTREVRLAVLCLTECGNSHAFAHQGRLSSRPTDVFACRHLQTNKCNQLNHPDVPILPEQIPDDLTNEDELLKLIHQVIFDVRLQECSVLVIDLSSTH